MPTRVRDISICTGATASRVPGTEYNVHKSDAVTRSLHHSNEKPIFRHDVFEPKR